MAWREAAFFQFLVRRNSRLGQPFQTHLETIIQLRLVSSQAFLDVQLISVYCIFLYSRKSSYFQLRIVRTMNDIAGTTIAEARHTERS